MSEKHIGSSVDDSLKEESIFEGSQAQAVKEALAWRFAPVEGESMRAWKRSLLAVLSAFLISRILFYLAGLRFDTTPIANHLQFIDPELMRHRLAESIFYLHVWPPGFNLAIGLIVKLFPTSYGVVLNIIYLGIGISIGVLLLRLMWLFRVPEWLAAILTILFVISPGSAVYENTSTYEYPILLLLILSANLLFRFARKPTAGSSAAFFGCIAVLAMIRNQTNILFIILLAGTLAVVFKSKRAALLKGTLPAIALILAICIKNWVLFHAFTTSTWLGMQTGHITTFELSSSEADRLIAAGVATPLVKLSPLGELRDYAAFVETPPKTGIPVLDQVETSTGHTNFNNPAFLKIGSLYMADARSVLRHYPIAIWRSVVDAWYSYFLPTSDCVTVYGVREPIDRYDRVYNAVLFGQFLRARTHRDLRAVRSSHGVLGVLPYTGLYLIPGLAWLVGWGLFQLVSARRRALLRTDEAMVMVFMVLTVVFVTAVGNSLAPLDNNRYRFQLDGFYLVLAGIFLSRLVRSSGGFWGSKSVII
jgi:hypothetical protein